MKKLILFSGACILCIAVAAQQNVGIGTNAPNTKLDIKGALALREGAALTLGNGGSSGGTNDNIVLPYISGTTDAASFYRITGPTGPFSVYGIIPATGADGEVVTLINTTGKVMTVVNSGSFTTTNSIITQSGANLVDNAGTGANSSITLQYSKNAGGSGIAGWFVTGTENFTTSVSSLPNLAGDVSGAVNSNTVGKINGSPLGTTSGASTGAVLQWNGSNWGPSSVSGGSTGFWTLSGSNLYPQSTGYNVGIGTASPGQKLDVNGIIRGNSSIYTSSNGSNWFGLEPDQTESPAHAAIVNSGAARLTQYEVTSPYNAGFAGAIITGSTNTELSGVPAGGLYSSGGGYFGGNVGIGTTAPPAPFSTVYGSAGTNTYSGSPGNWYDPTNFAGYIQNNTNATSHYGLLVSDYWRSSENFVFAVDGRYLNTGTVSGDSHNPYLIVRGDGNVGIGTAAPSAQLHTTGTVRFQNYTNGFLQVDGSGNLFVSGGSNGSLAQGGPYNVYTSGSSLLSSNNVLYNGTNNSGFYQQNEAPYNLNYVAGDNSMPFGYAINDARTGEHAGFVMVPQASNGGNGNMIFYVGNDGSNQFQFVPFTWDGANNHIGTPVMTIGAYTGMVGIGTSSPAYTLDLNQGTFGFGVSNERTEYQNDAGAGNGATQSGFFQTSAPAPAADWPAGASSWWHLIDCRHTNASNNYAMQFAGSFFDQNLYFRKTNGSPTTAWSRVMTSNDISGTTDYVSKFTSANTIGNSLLYDNGTAVGIGTTNPAQGRLWVQDGDIWVTGNNSKLAFTTDESTDPTPNASIIASQNGFSGSSADIIFNTWNGSSNAEIMRIRSNSYVGIGTTSPGYTLDVNGSGGIRSGLTTYGTAYSNYGGSAEIYANGDNHTGGGIEVADDGGFFDYNDGWVTYGGSTGLKIVSNTTGGANAGANLVQCWMYDQNGANLTDKNLGTGTNEWGMVGTSGAAWWEMYSYYFYNPSLRSLKKDITPVEGGVSEQVMSDLDKLHPYLYRYNLETDEWNENTPAKYRPGMHLGLILDETPDYIQAQSYDAVDIYSVATLGVAAAKHNREEIKELKSSLGMENGQKEIHDFGSVEVTGEQWINFSDDFSSQLNGSIPVVTATGNTENAVLTIVEKSSKGFKIKVSGADKPVNIDYIAMARVKMEVKPEEKVPENILKKMYVTDDVKNKVKEYWGGEAAREKAREEKAKAEGEKMHEEIVNNMSAGVKQAQQSPIK